MPASRARISPCASDRFERTMAIVASSRPFAMASMIAWRFDPRPEIRIAIRRPENGSYPFELPADSVERVDISQTRKELEEIRRAVETGFRTAIDPGASL